MPWDPWLPRCTKNLARSCQDSQDASKRVNPGSQEVEVKIIENRNGNVIPDRPLESMEILSREMNPRLSQDIDSLMNLIQTQVNRTISSAINDGVKSEIQTIVGNMLLREKQV